MCRHTNEPHRALCIASTVMISCVLTASPATAAPEAATAPPPPTALPAATLPTLVLEAHVGERPSEIASIVDPVLDELEQRGFAAHPDSIAKVLGGRAPRP